VPFVDNSSDAAAQIVADFVGGFVVHDNDLTVVRINAATKAIAFLDFASLLHFFVIFVRFNLMMMISKLWRL
jgi:hypothetical protein